ncbi:DUF5667 domain-containing protein [Streptomyces daliensis]|uniref:DUF5667 domain-containing protein n=1 Tax=Streptomyces daliensis TaxID=299421 RepID=A0A8T4J0S2_9ACTN|nr:hypothetical protein [Streptomyces daliensis]
MIGSVSASRRANAFAQALDEQLLDEATAADQTAGDGVTGAAPPERPPERVAMAGGSPEDMLLLALADGLGALPQPELDPEVKTVQRARLIAAMETAFAEGGSAAGSGRLPEQRGPRSGKGTHRATGLGPLGKLRPRSRLAKGLTAGGLGVGVAAGALGGVAAASSDALPGDSLYGLKRGMEDLKLDVTDVTGGDTDRGKVYLDHASTRLQEARRLLERGRSGELDHESLGEVRKALAGMRHDATEGHKLLSAVYERDGDIGPMQSLSSFSKSHRATWSQLRDRLPVQLRDVGDEVSSVFDAIDSDVGPLERLFRGSPEGAPQERRSEAPERTEDGGSSPRPTPSASEGTDGRTGGGQEKPSPSGSESRDDGLLGGGGILDPSKKPQQRDEPSRPGKKDSSEPSLPDTDITLPPIVPEVLPGLNDLSKGGE